MRTKLAVAVAAILSSTCALITPALAGGPPPGRADERVRFDDHAIIRAVPRTEGELKALLALTPDVWSHGIGVGPIDVRIPPENRAALDAIDVPYEVLIENVQALIDREALTAGGEPGLDGPWFSDYKTYDQINVYLQDLADLRPDIATVIEVGTTIEGRVIYGLEITGTTPGPGVAGVFFNGCQHAREWVATMATTYIADQLVRGYENDPDITDLVNTRVFYIVPVTNPDGFVYTWSTYRLWRKNRRDNGNGSFGIDLNRNWSYEWGGVGSSGDPRSDLYRGTAPFSEPETASVRNFLLDRPWIVRHVDIHSYSQYVLYPWAFTPTPTIEGDAFPVLAQQIATAIGAVHGMTYLPGSWYSRLYPSSGVMQDYTYAERGAWGWTFELRDTGRYGFILPADQILPCAEEIFAGAMELTAANVETRLLLESTNLLRGQRATLVTHRGAPGSRTYFVYSFAGIGTTNVPPLGITLNLDQPVLIGSSIADGDGMATVSRTIPQNAPLRDIWLQAAQQGRRSGIVERTIE